MSNPVPPPGGAYQPQQGPVPGQQGPVPGQPGIPAQPGPGYPAPGAAYPPPPGYPAPGVPIQPGDPAQFSAYLVQPQKSRRGRLVSVLAIIAVVIVGIAVRLGFSSLFDKDKTAEAKTGDCVAAQGKVPTDDNTSTDAEAEVVSCSSAKAAYKVLAKVNGETDTNSKSCDKYFTDEKSDYFVYSSSNGSGYLLCLQALKAS